MKKEQAVPNLVENEKQVLKFWETNQIFNKLKAQNAGSGKYFAFLDGPITANNKMGLHHAWNRSLKDIMLRYQGMQGKQIHYQNGFDAQGLWVEVNVEKDLGLSGKRDIEKYGMDKFTEKCIERVNHFSKEIVKDSIRLGQWMDWDNSYYTNSDNNIETIWYFLKECYKRGWLKEKYRPMPWCARCGTSLSEHEMADEYRDVVHTAVFFKLPIEGKNADMLVWTTTPWTLSANVALAVNADLDYVECKVKSSSRNLIVCESAKKVLKDDLIEVVKTFKGAELVGLTYETCFPMLSKQNFEHKIVAWDHVDATEGSGCVHIAPGCGAEDFDLGQTIGLPNIIPVDENGIFYPDFGFLAGKSAFEVNDLVFDRLKEAGKLYYTHNYKHRYPFCWRCKNPVIFRLIKEWVISMDEIRPQLLSAIETVEFQPDFMKKRMKDWLNNMGDWSISRKRYYGLPLPIYVCPKCGEVTIVGSKAELEKLSSKAEVEALPHLHRPYIDKIKITCPKCGEKVERIPEVGDCWLDAGVTPFSTKKYFTDKEFFNHNFPAECVIEAKEQIRLWFYSLLVMSVTLTGKAPYKKVIGFPMLLDKDGNKLSKSSPNNIPLPEAFDKFGADIIRYFFAGNNQLSDLIFSFSSTDDIKRKLMAFWNIYVFFNTYASIDNPKLDGFKLDVNSLDITDKWLIERTNNLITASADYYEHNQTFAVTKAFEEYVDDVSNWYIRVNRRRFWKSEDEQDKLNAYYSLYYSLKATLKVMAPIIPFMSEYVWQNLVRELEPNESESVMLGGYAKVTQKVVTPKIMTETELARELIAIGSRLRNENQLMVKIPLRKMYVNLSGDDKEVVERFGDIIKSELNVKDLEIEKDYTKFNLPKLSVNFKQAGAALKGDVQKLKNALTDATESEMNAYVMAYKTGKISVKDLGELDSSLFTVTYVPKPEFVMATENNVTVVLDITIDEELEKEGISRELIRALQVLRKEADFEISKRISVKLETTSEKLSNVIAEYKEKIAKEVLIKDFELAEKPTIEKTVEVAGISLKVLMK